MKYIASFSGGKDSMATIILAHEHGEPLDEIIFSEVMFDETTSGELPEHIDFIKNVCAPLFESWGYKFTILHAEKTFYDEFFHTLTRSKVENRNGKISGFPMSGRCKINAEIKVKAIKDYFKNAPQNTQYVGIAIDEPERLARLQGGKISLLEKYGLTEKDARELCEKYGLLSPIYKTASRCGCWFCPNATERELKALYANHNNLFMKLCELEKIPEKVGHVFDTRANRSINKIKSYFDIQAKQLELFS